MKRDDTAITRRRSPLHRAWVTVRDGIAAAARKLLRDRVAAFLLVASVAITITFFVLLDDIKPSSPGVPAALSTVLELAREDQVTTATLLDEDSRVVVTTADGLI